LKFENSKSILNFKLKYVKLPYLDLKYGKLNAQVQSMYCFIQPSDFSKACLKIKSFHYTRSLKKFLTVVKKQIGFYPSSRKKPHYH